MNDLTQYRTIEPLLVRGTTIAYFGTGLLSRIISDLTHGGPSHVQLVEYVDPNLGPIVAESTMEPGRNGVQRNQLRQSLLSYPGGSSVAALFLDDSSRARGNWDQLSGFIDSCIAAHVEYDVWGLVKFLFPEAVETSAPPSHKMVCSAFRDAAFQQIGVLQKIVSYSDVSPEMVIEERIYSEWKPLLGNPRLVNFNSL